MGMGGWMGGDLFRSFLKLVFVGPWVSIRVCRVEYTAAVSGRHVL